jgi:hypothetical protein
MEACIVVLCWAIITMLIFSLIYAMWEVGYDLLYEEEGDQFLEAMKKKSEEIVTEGIKKKATKVKIKSSQ